MPDVFEGRDLSGAVFWGVNLQRTLFRDANLSGSQFFHTLWTDVSVDGVISRLIVNGVDVTGYVNAHDRWYPLRTQLEPATAAELRHSWAVLQQHWAELLDRVAAMPPDAALRSVNGEWSVRDTLRHLVFAMDKWFVVPFLGEHGFSAIGLPNSESQTFDWPGLDPNANPSFDEVLAVRADYCARFTRFIDALEFDTLPEITHILENGAMPTVMCFHAVLEEQFEHLRYTLRDLDQELG